MAGPCDGIQGQPPHHILWRAGCLASLKLMPDGSGEHPAQACPPVEHSRESPHPRQLLLPRLGGVMGQVLWPGPDDGRRARRPGWSREDHCQAAWEELRVRGQTLGFAIRGCQGPRKPSPRGQNGDTGAVWAPISFSIWQLWFMESNINPDFCIFKTCLRCFRIWVHLALADPRVCPAISSILGR